MAGSNDEATRKQIFEWIEKNEKTLYSLRRPMQPVGVYFSPKSRDYDPGGFLPSFRGTLVAMLQAHREFQAVTPRMLTEFQGRVLVLPKVSELNDDERTALKAFTAHGGRLVALGANASGIPESPGLTVLPLDPGGAFFSALEHDFAAASSKPPSGLLNPTKVADEIELDAPATVASNFGRVNGEPHIFLANFGRLVPSKIAIPAPAKDIRVRIPAAMGNSATYLPFLGEAQRLHGEKKGNQAEFNLPALERGAVVWVGETQ